VGDGINDAPALAGCRHRYRDWQRHGHREETGGIVLIKDDLRDVALGVELSKKTMRKINSNLFWAFAYNAVMIPIAAAGLLGPQGPMYAAGAMAISSLTVVSNSALLKFTRLGSEKVHDDRSVLVGEVK